MLFGIGFLTVITAAITSTFVARSRLEQAARARIRRRQSSSVGSTQRLERIEAPWPTHRPERGPPESDAPVIAIHATA